MDNFLINLDYYNNSIDSLTFGKNKSGSHINREYKINKLSSKKSMKLRQLGLQVTEDCNLRCTYCYQCKKIPNKMSLDECKQAIDMIFGCDNDKYCNFIFHEPFILHFIGGEPFLEDKTIYYASKYFVEKLKENHMEDLNWYIWIPTNGIPLYKEYAQKFVEEFKDKLSLTISLDGCEECHNACRKTITGEGSYAATKKAFIEFNKRLGKGHYPDTKFTMSPDNIQFYSKSMIEWIQEGVYNIFSNWILEGSYSIEDARKYYYEAKKVADYIIDNDMEYLVRYAVFDRTSDTMQEPYTSQVACGAAGYNIAVIPGGYILPCVRLAASSLDDDVEPYVIGTLTDGIGYDEKTLDRFNHIWITKYDISSFKCFNCPLNSICIDCVGNDYNIRKIDYNLSKHTGECNIVVADYLARAYGINKFYRKKENINKNYFFKSYKLIVPDDMAIPIIGEEELNMIKHLSKEYLSHM